MTGGGDIWVGRWRSDTWSSVLCCVEHITGLRFRYSPLLDFEMLDRLFPLNQMPSESQETKKKLKTSVTFFIVLVWNVQKFCFGGCDLKKKMLTSLIYLKRAQKQFWAKHVFFYIMAIPLKNKNFWEDFFCLKIFILSKFHSHSVEIKYWTKCLSVCHYFVCFVLFTNRHNKNSTSNY